MLQIELPRRHGTSLAVSRLAHESSRITPPGRAPGQAPGQPSDFTTLKIESLSDVSWEGRG